MKKPKGFSCIACGECCTGFGPDYGVLVFSFEIPRLARGLRVSKEIFLQRYCVKTELRKDGVQYEVYRLRYRDGSCVFLREDLRCGVHAFKPEQCRRTPFGFFWNGSRDYGCMIGVVVPRGWTTAKSDAKLARRLIPIKHMRSK